MIVEHIFNVVLFSFVMIVPLIPIKFKMGFLPFSADFIFSVLLIISGMLYMAQCREKRENARELLQRKGIFQIALLMVIFILLSLGSVVYAKNTPIVISETLRFIEYMMIFFLLLVLASKLTIQRALKIFYYTILFACLFGLLQFVFNWSKFSVGGFFQKGRVFSTFVNPNYWGAAINLVIYEPILQLQSREQSKRQRAFHWGCFSLLGINLILCATLVSWAGFIIGFSVILVLKYRRRLYQLLLPLGLILGGIVVKFSHLNEGYLKERLILWKAGLYMCRDHLLTGVGNGNFIYNYHNVIRKYGLVEYGKLKLSVHNSFIKMFAELGVIGGSLFTGIYFYLLYLIYDVYKRSRVYHITALGFLGGLTAYLFQNLFNNLTFVPQLNVFVFIVCALLIKGNYMEGQGEKYE